MPSCRIQNCLATRSHPNITMHQFPKDPDVRKRWLLFCSSEDGPNLFVCSRHFRPADYENIFMTSSRRKLRREAVPTIRDPVESDRASRVKIRNRKKLVTDLLAENEQRCREAASYKTLVAEVFEPLKPFDLLSSGGLLGETVPAPTSPYKDNSYQNILIPQQQHYSMVSNQSTFSGGDSGHVLDRFEQQQQQVPRSDLQQHDSVRSNQSTFSGGDSSHVLDRFEQQQQQVPRSNLQQHDSVRSKQSTFSGGDSGHVLDRFEQQQQQVPRSNQQQHDSMRSNQSTFSGGDSSHVLDRFEQQQQPILRSSQQQKYNPDRSMYGSDSGDVWPKISDKSGVIDSRSCIGTGSPMQSTGKLPIHVTHSHYTIHILPPAVEVSDQKLQAQQVVKSTQQVGLPTPHTNQTIQQQEEQMQQPPLPQPQCHQQQPVAKPMEVTPEPITEPVVETGLEVMDDTLLSQMCLFDPVLNSTTYESSVASSTWSTPKEAGFVQVKRGTIKKIKIENCSLRGIIRSLRAELNEKDKIINSLSNQSQQKSKEIQQLRTQHAESLAVQEHQIRSEIDAAFGKIFTKNQTDLILGRKKKVKWSDEEIMLAFSLRYHSQPAYEMVRKELKIPLPSLRRLREFASGMDMRGGVLEDVFSVLGSTAKFMSPLERVVVVGYDEMKVKETSELDKRTDTHLGPHKEMQVIAIRGLFSKWKTPIFVDFDCPMTLEILNDVITRLHAKGFTVAAIVHDNGGGNLAVLKQAEINHAQQKVSIQHPVTKEEIFFFPDAPHLLKLIRNWLLDHGFYYKGKLITKRFLVELVKKASTLKNPFTKSQSESSNVELNALFKLTMKHVTCEGSERQNVRLAAQLLSHTTAVNLRRHFGEYEEAVLLADIIDIINSWFDTMNSSRIHESIPGKQCYGMAEDVQNRNLDKMEELMSNMRTLHKHSMPAAKHLQIFQKAVLTSIQSLKRLLIKMRLDYGITFIMTFKLDQDFLENFFAMIRLNGGSNDHPSPLEALNRIRLIILGKSLTFPMSVNQNTEVKKDVEEHFLMSEIFRKKKETTSDQPDERTDEEDDDIEAWTYQPKRRALEELDGQHYVYGYMARSLMKSHDWCGQYTHQLESSPDDIGKENYVEDLSRGGLVQPSQQWTEVADQMEDYFNFIHNRGPYNEEPAFRNSENICKRSMKKLSKQFPNVPQDMIKSFVKKRVNIRVRHLKKQIQEKKTHRYKVMKNNKRQKRTELKADLTKNQKKLKHFLT